ncbi:hypothetical protein CK203_060444 [Vitis vinifera]|uniref:Uncharacterized protein n=1 Tax=Vitis vinifera TaxID=29760 RepID=A0A438FR63_VITVI|nr:hypothetical protein CK203_060444 [Vitis vinifera]
MTAYSAEPGAPAEVEHPGIPHAEQPQEPQPIETPADTRAPAPVVPSAEPIPEVHPLFLLPHHSPPLFFQPHHSLLFSRAEDYHIHFRVQSSMSHFADMTTSQSTLTQEMAALRAHQEQIIATQTQHTAI